MHSEIVQEWAMHINFFETIKKISILNGKKKCLGYFYAVYLMTNDSRDKGAFEYIGKLNYKLTTFSGKVK